MRLQVIIETELPSQTGKFKELLRNTFDLSDDLHYDYQALINGAKAIYPNYKLFIHLKIVTL